MRGEDLLRIYSESENVHAPSGDEAFVFSQLSKNIENATMKARRFGLAPRGVIIYLRAQDFKSVGIEVKLSRRTAIPNELIEAIRPGFRQVFRPGTLYRPTGAVLVNLEDDSIAQLDLFGAADLTNDADEARRGGP